MFDSLPIKTVANTLAINLALQALLPCPAAYNIAAENELRQPQNIAERRRIAIILPLKAVIA